MSIYVIRNDSDDHFYIAPNAEHAQWWLTASRFVKYTIEEQADASDAEKAVVESLNEWLLQHYNDGAHWIYETTEEDQHIVALRELGGDIEAYKADLKRGWELLEDVSADVRAA